MIRFTQQKFPRVRLIENAIFCSNNDPQLMFDRANLRKGSFILFSKTVTILLFKLNKDRLADYKLYFLSFSNKKHSESDFSSIFQQFLDFSRIRRRAVSQCACRFCFLLCHAASPAQFKTVLVVGQWSKGRKAENLHTPTFKDCCSGFGQPWSVECKSIYKNVKKIQVQMSSRLICTIAYF